MSLDKALFFHFLGRYWFLNLNNIWTYFVSFMNIMITLFSVISACVLHMFTEELNNNGKRMSRKAQCTDIANRKYWNIRPTHHCWCHSGFINREWVLIQILTPQFSNKSKTECKLIHTCNVTRYSKSLAITILSN